MFFSVMYRLRWRRSFLR